MGYYTIQNNGLLTAETEQALARFYDNITPLPSDYEKGKYIVEDGKLVLNPNWEEEKEEQRREAIKKLSLTKREVFLALYNDKQITPEQIKAQITDPSALIEFEYATDYFRGNPLIDSIGTMLGYTTKQLDYLFEHKEFPNESDESNADASSVSEEETQTGTNDF